MEGERERLSGRPTKIVSTYSVSAHISRNTITYHNALCLSPQNFAFKHCLQFLLGVKMAPRETENNADAKFWGDKQRALWYVMVFSGVVNWSTGSRGEN